MKASRLKESDSESLVLVDVALSEKREIHTFLNRSGHESLKAEFLQLNQISNLKAAATIVRQWIVIAAAMGFALWLQQWWSYGVAIFVIATRQHALAVLMHEATHWRLFSKRWANDLFGNVFCAFPVQMMVSRYRSEHLTHHQSNMSDADPYKQEWMRDADWHWPKTPQQASWLFVRDLMGLNLLRLTPSLWRWSPWSIHFSPQLSPSALTFAERFSWYGFLLGVAAVLTVSGHWFHFLLLWVLPLYTVMIALVRARSAAEHLNLPGTNEFNRTRHIQASWIERLTVAPLNINMHLSHHLFPSVPQYNLPKLHQILLRHPEYQKGSLYDRYFGSGKSAYNEMIRKVFWSDRRSGGGSGL